MSNFIDLNGLIVRQSDVLYLQKIIGLTQEEEAVLKFPAEFKPYREIPIEDLKALEGEERTRICLKDGQKFTLALNYKEVYKKVFGPGASVLID